MKYFRADDVKIISQKIFFRLGRDGVSPEVSVRSLLYDDSSLNPSKIYSFFSVKSCRKRTKNQMCRGSAIKKHFSRKLWIQNFSSKMGQSWPLFVYFRSFLVTISIQIEKKHR